MFCQVNPFAFTAAYQTNTLSPGAQKLCRYLGMALQCSLKVFTTKKDDEEKQTVSSQRSLSLERTVTGEEKDQKKQTLSQIAVQKEKENTKNTKQVDDKNQEVSQKLVQKELGIKKQKPIRRIIRKKPKVKQSVEVKRQLKIVKQKLIETENLVNFTADIPTLRGISSRQIMQKIEQLRKRAVVEWELHDPTNLRRKRFLKHLQ